MLSWNEVIPYSILGNCGKIRVYVIAYTFVLLYWVCPFTVTLWVWGQSLLLPHTSAPTLLPTLLTCVDRLQRASVLNGSQSKVSKQKSSPGHFSRQWKHKPWVHRRELGFIKPMWAMPESRELHFSFFHIFFLLSNKKYILSSLTSQIAQTWDEKNSWMKITAVT